jgi:hypothetical protein
MKYEKSPMPPSVKTSPTIFKRRRFVGEIGEITPVSFWVSGSELNTLPLLAFSS